MDAAVLCCSWTLYFMRTGSYKCKAGCGRGNLTTVSTLCHCGPDLRGKITVEQVIHGVGD